MQKGYKRNAKGKAVLHCFIGLFAVIVIVLVAYFWLTMDYSDKLSADTSVRPYVELTPSPEPEQVPVVAPQASAETIAEPTAISTPVVTPTPTPVPTASPTPTPAPSPTPMPTSMAAVVSPTRSDGYSLPDPSTLSASYAITSSFRSVADDYRYIELKGYAYMNDATYDAANAAVFLVLLPESSEDDSVLVLPTMTAGASGADHSGAACANAASSDFTVILDGEALENDIYSLGVVLMYPDATDPESGHIEYFRFPDNVTFTVLNSRFLSDVATTTSASAGGTAGMDLTASGADTAGVLPSATAVVQ